MQGGLKVAFHYPMQQLRSSGTMKYQWQSVGPEEQRNRNCRGFYMRFRIKGVEVLSRRNKQRSPCNLDWQSDDKNLTEKIIKLVGCQPPGGLIQANKFRDVDHFPKCADSRHITHILDPTNDELNGYVPPCHIIEKLLFDYDEGVVLPPFR